MSPLLPATSIAHRLPGASPTPDRVRLAVKLQRSVVGHDCVLCELGGKEVRVDLRAVSRNPWRHRRVESAPDVKQIACRHVLLDHGSTRLTASPPGSRMDRHELLVAKDRVPGEEFGRLDLMVRVHRGSKCTYIDRKRKVSLS